MIRWGSIGAGDVIARKAGPPLDENPRSALVAMTRRDQQAGREMAGRFNNCRYVATIEELVEADDIDAIYVATPDECHHQHTLLALNAGKPVLVEKEMAKSRSECDEMIALAAAKNLPLAVAFYRRSHPVMEKARRLIAEGAIGELQSVWMNDQFPIFHRLDLSMFLAGDVKEVWQTEETLPPDSHAGVGSVLHCRHANGSRSYGNLTMRETHDVEQVVIDGSESRLVIHNLKAGLMSRTWKWNSESLNQPSLPYAHTGIMANMVDHLLDGVPLACSGDEGRKTTIIFDLVRAGLGEEPQAVLFPSS